MTLELIFELDKEKYIPAPLEVILEILLFVIVILVGTTVKYSMSIPIMTEYMLLFKKKK